MKKLPLSWNWYKREQSWQVEELEAGNHMIPTFGLGAKEQNYSETQKQKDAPLVAKAKELGLPIILRANNVFYDPDSFTWFQQFGHDPLEYDKHGWLVFVKKLTPEEVTAAFPEGLTEAQLPVRMPGSTNTVVGLHADGSATYLDTFTKRFSYFSPLLPDWAYQLGYLYATSDAVVELAKAYPEPPVVFCMDNGEIGDDWSFQWDDVRQLYQHTNDASIGVDVSQESHFKKMKDFFASWEKPTDGPNDAQVLSGFPELLKYNYSNDTWNGFVGKLKAVAVNTQYANFNQGFRDGLATHNRHWAEVAGWVEYGLTGEELRNQGMNNHKNPRGGSTGYGNGKHRYGNTGDMYFHPWHGPWYQNINIGKLSNTKVGRDYSNILGGHRPRFTLMWENNNTNLAERPNREQWKALVRANIWINDPEYVGHWVSHGTAKDNWKMTTYWDEVKKCVEEIYNSPTLKKYWQYSDVLESLDASDDYFNKEHPVLYKTPWFLQHVVENNRYQTAFRDEVYTNTEASAFRHKMQMAGRGIDKWRNYSKFDVNVLALARRLKTDTENSILLFVAGTKQEYLGVTVKLDVDNEVKSYVVDAPVGGVFYIIDVVDGTIDVLDPRLGTGPVPVEPPVVEPEDPVVPDPEEDPVPVEPDPVPEEPVDPPVVDPVPEEPVDPTPEEPVDPPVVDPVPEEPVDPTPEEPVVPPVVPPTPQQMIDEAQNLLNELEGLVAADLTDEVQAIASLIDQVELEVFGSGGL